MSSFWAPDELGEATAVSGLGSFGSMGSRSSFRSRFGAMGEGTGWTATRAETADHLAPEAEQDPIEQASQEGFLIGFQEGERMTREALEADDAARRELTAAIGQLNGAGEGALAAMIGQAVFRLVTQIVGSVEVDEAMLAERCAAVASHIDPDDGKAVLEVNPEDIPLIDTDNIGVALMPNPQVGRGSVRLATSDGWIEDGLEVRLSRLKAMMDDMEGRL